MPLIMSLKGFKKLKCFILKKNPFKNVKIYRKNAKNMHFIEIIGIS